jgi:hypothetical protein
MFSGGGEAKPDFMVHDLAELVDLIDKGDFACTV